MTINLETYEQVVKAVHMLRPEQQVALVKTIEIDALAGGITRAQLIAEAEALRALGAFDRVNSLRNRFANPAMTYLTDQQLLGAIHESSVEWKIDLAELGDVAEANTQG